MATLVALLFALGVMNTFVSQSRLLINNSRQNDAIADWIAARAAFDGLDPYQDVTSLAAHYRGRLQDPPTLEGHKGIHFRPPGALLLLAPLTLVDSNDAFDVVVGLTALLVIVMAILIARLVGVGLPQALFVAPLGALMLPIVETFNWGAQSVIIATLLLAAWIEVRERDSFSGGVLIGLAATLKLYPALLVVPLLAHRRRRAAMSALGSFTILQIAALAFLPGLKLGRALEAMSDAGRIWGPFRGNASLAGKLAALGLPWETSVFLSLGVGGLLLWFGWKRIRDLDGRFAFTLLVATLLSPLSWLHYDVAIIPVVAWLAVKRSHPVTTAAVVTWTVGVLYSWPLLLHIFGRLDLTGSLTSFAGRIFLIVIFVFVGSEKAEGSRDEGLPTSVYAPQAATP